MENSRIIIDPHTFNLYGTPGPGLGSIESASHANSAEDEILARTHNVIYRATSRAFQEYQNALAKHELHGKGDLSGGCKPALFLSASTRTAFDIASSQNPES